MPRVRVTLSANAGVSVDICGHRVWVDALHEIKQPTFSALTPALQSRMLRCEAFFKPEYICFTHCHEDHYSHRLTAVAKAMWPEANLCLPEPEFEDQIRVTGDKQLIEADGLTIRFVRLPHEGVEYADVNHYGVILNAGGCNVVIAGDCAVASQELAEAVRDISVDLAILNFPWATLGKGKKFLSQTLQANHILLCHLPFAEDDVCGYRASASRAVRTLSEQMDIRILSEPLQMEEINI